MLNGTDALNRNSKANYEPEDFILTLSWIITYIVGISCRSLRFWFFVLLPPDFECYEYNDNLLLKKIRKFMCGWILWFYIQHHNLYSVKLGNDANESICSSPVYLFPGWLHKIINNHQNTLQNSLWKFHCLVYPDLDCAWFFPQFRWRLASKRISLNPTLPPNFVLTDKAWISTLLGSS